MIKILLSTNMQFDLYNDSISLYVSEEELKLIAEIATREGIYFTIIPNKNNEMVD